MQVGDSLLGSWVETGHGFNSNAMTTTLCKHIGKILPGHSNRACSTKKLITKSLKGAGGKNPLFHMHKNFKEDCLALLCEKWQWSGVRRMPQRLAWSPPQHQADPARACARHLESNGCKWHEKVHVTDRGDMS